MPWKLDCFGAFPRNWERWDEKSSVEGKSSSHAARALTSPGAGLWSCFAA